MHKEALLLFSMVFLILNLCFTYSNSGSLNLRSLNLTGLISGASSIAFVCIGLILYFKKKSSLSKTLSAALVTVLLFSALSGTMFTVFGSDRDVGLSKTEVQTDLAGDVGCSVFQLADGTFVLNSVNQSCTFIMKLDSAYNPI